MYHRNIEGYFRKIRNSYRWSWFRSKPHSHILWSPTEDGSLRIISIIKSITARRIFKRFPTIKKRELWGGEFWSDGKYIGTVGEAASEETIRSYIKNQSIDKKVAQMRIRQLQLFDLWPTFQTAPKIPRPLAAGSFIFSFSLLIKLFQ